MPDGVNDPRRPRPKLILHVEGAREDELARGLSAAEAVLRRDGDIDLEAAMVANASRDFIMLDGDLQPINDITEEEHRLAKLWEDALSAALDAGCAGWAEEPVRGFWLGIDTGGDTIRPWYVDPPIATFRLKDE
ncbi:hypothetical protein [Limobrevibacterium gyesilva]|uniref:Uncharacterized protein n=1 Tax=Limobrevibacterium gyesilva TaxID=2991712 RepID=A0AA42CGP9_9PROT|nr:hypothetical protein [Limobrevibacterium gyesilva]MCW3476311.1 hypothetical protein [Limobrevibacterium gyesilva]